MSRLNCRGRAADRGGASYLRRAFLLGLVQGPAELLPVSSSAHAALLPGLLGWEEAELDRAARNEREVALHAGTAAALSGLLCAPGVRAAVDRELRELDRRRLAALALALAPPALAGLLLERRLERRPATPPTIAVGLVAGAAAMALADSRGGGRRLAEVGPADGLALGVAQALALLPGVSRSGATLTAARLRGFAREDSQGLSWRAGLPVLVGAAALKAVRRGPAGGDVRRSSSDGSEGPASGGPDRPAYRRRAAHAVAAAGAFLSTLAAAPLIHPSRRGRPLAPFALYRCALAVVAVHRSRPARRQPAVGRRGRRQGAAGGGRQPVAGRRPAPGRQPAAGIENACRVRKIGA
ncbi:MAG TPA: undecaprenyl-diphosphate phosphatase [Solirubrobacteraceae bacterium]|nr:undecaprenyl-diphosphate phosphatase [Solirubrobacteraceae bacterium]